jgi:hypothetical protein
MPMKWSDNFYRINIAGTFYLGFSETISISTVLGQSIFSELVNRIHGLSAQRHVLLSKFHRHLHSFFFLKTLINPSYSLSRIILWVLSHNISWHSTKYISRGLSCIQLWLICAIVWILNVPQSAMHWKLGLHPMMLLGGDRNFRRWSLSEGS